jgi:hypothetical protein
VVGLLTPHHYRNVLQLGSRIGSILVHLVVYGVLEGFAVANMHAATKEYDYYYYDSMVNVDIMRYSLLETYSVYSENSPLSKPQSADRPNFVLGDTKGPKVQHENFSTNFESVYRF